MFSNSLRKITQITIYLSLSSIIAYGNNNTYIDAYSNLSGLKIKDLEKFTSDENFKIASAFVFDSTKQENKMISKGGNPHDVSAKVEFEEIKMPNYKDALVYFRKSAEQNNNPISAYAGSYILQNFTNIQEDANLKALKLFSDVLYNQEIKICQAYLQQGDIFENGYFVKKDEKRAIEIYKEGLKNNNCNTSWMQAVLNSKLIRLEQNNAK
ncbi:hypothetical protein ACOTWR_06210 [Aliarcobacter butzleri]|uniref:hypothetical protein n=1 Tax=Aliarcobacter butzleri TaxID=28197 RepID=UPI0021B293E3|nr:hypothetical protein [Aliarcobacter butzleri]MCT7578645.1 hypothetical protein [Aliarcobacter butzleri]MCT7647586.1 hypothetical protein [Aliarcobacter butzleri]